MSDLKFRYLIQTEIGGVLQIHGEVFDTFEAAVAKRFEMLDEGGWGNVLIIRTDKKR